jgi:hypothetical protein
MTAKTHRRGFKGFPMPRYDRNELRDFILRGSSDWSINAEELPGLSDINEVYVTPMRDGELLRVLRHPSRGYYLVCERPDGSFSECWHLEPKIAAARTSGHSR